MQNQQKLLVTATVDEIMDALGEVFRNIFSEHVNQFSKPSEEVYLSRTETAKLLNVSLVTLHKWTDEEKLPSYKIDGSSKVYYLEKEVRNLISSSRKTMRHES